MSITSLNFAGFVTVTLVLYYILPRRQQNWLLLVMSCAFYVTWSWFYALVLAALMVMNFVLAGRIRREGSDGPASASRALLRVGIGVNLAALALFKYSEPEESRQRDFPSHAHHAGKRSVARSRLEYAAVGRYSWCVSGW